MEQFVTVSKAALMLGISLRHVYTLLQRGVLQEAGRSGRVILLRRADVERLAEGGWPGRRVRRSG